jgi:hypothetical protein
MSIHAVQHWFDINDLWMNPDKTEAIVFGTCQRVNGPARMVKLCCVNIQRSSSVGCLGITIDDKTLSFDEQVDNIFKSSKFHLRALHHIQKHISDAQLKGSTAKTFAC